MTLVNVGVLWAWIARVAAAVASRPRVERRKVLCGEFMLGAFKLKALLRFLVQRQNEIETYEGALQKARLV